jgi:ssDNA thymidine ADP-ribosyltransferase, DarT
MGYAAIEPNREWMLVLKPENSWIFRIAHIENVPWILAHGLHCRNGGVCDPNYVAIGNPDLIDKRHYRGVPIAPGGTLSDYIPFYFTPYTPMLLNIKTGRSGVPKRPMSEIVILVASLRHIAEEGIPFVFTDRHAYLETANFFNDVKHLGQIEWGPLQRRDFKRDPDNPEKFEKYQAEALIHRHLAVTALAGIGCYGPLELERLREMLRDAGIAVKVGAAPDWYI